MTSSLVEVVLEGGWADVCGLWSFSAIATGCNEERMHTMQVSKKGCEKTIPLTESVLDRWI